MFDDQYSPASREAKAVLYNCVDGVFSKYYAYFYRNDIAGMYYQCWENALADPHERWQASLEADLKEIYHHDISILAYIPIDSRKSRYEHKLIVEYHLGAIDFTKSYDYPDGIAEMREDVDKNLKGLISMFLTVRQRKRLESIRRDDK